jgi:hypothetical protein
MDNHIETTVVDLKKRRIQNNHYRVLERVIKMIYYKVKGQMAKNNLIKTAVGKISFHRIHNS